MSDSMKAKWLVVNLGEEDQIDAICQTIRDLGREVRKVSMKDCYEGTNLYDPSDKNVIINGTITTTQYLTDTYGWISWLNMEGTKCSAYYPHFGEYLFQHPYHMLPIGDLRRMWNFLEGIYGEDGHLFVRPNENDKAFTAKVIEKRDCVYFDRAGQPLDMMVVVSRPKRLAVEYRLFMRGTKFLTGTTYRVDGQLLKTDHIPSTLPALAEMIATRCHYAGLSPVWVLDIAESPEGEFKVLEVSGSSCAGLYAADKKKIFEALSEEADLEIERRSKILIDTISL